MLSWTRHLKILNRLSFEIYNVCRPYLTYFLTWKRRKVKLFDVERSFKNFAKFLYRKRHNLSQRNITVTHFNFEVGFGSTVIRTSFWCLRKRWSQFGKNVKTQIKMSKKNPIFLDHNQNPFVQICKFAYFYFYQQIVFVLMINRRKGQLILEKTEAKIILRVRR